MEPSVSVAAVGKAAEGSSAVSLPTTKLLQFGVIGYGYWGPQLVRNLSSLAGSSVEYIADLKRDELARAHTYHQQARLTQRAADLFESDIHAIFIATPVHTHFTLARQALLAGKHVFVEKPLAARVSEV